MHKQITDQSARVVSAALEKAARWKAQQAAYDKPDLSEQAIYRTLMNGTPQAKAGLILEYRAHQGEAIPDQEKEKARLTACLEEIEETTELRARWGVVEGTRNR